MKMNKLTKEQLLLKEALFLQLHLIAMEEKDFDSMKSKTIIEGMRTLDRGKVSSFEGVCW